MNNPNQIPSHTLWVELTTRITTQPLHYRSGAEATAAESVHQLFTKTRELMEKHPEAKQFNELSLKLLNTTLRPYSARWHGWMTKSKPVPGIPGKSIPVFENEQTLRLFRSELLKLQEDIYHYQKAFKDLTEGKDIQPNTLEVINSFNNPNKKANLGAEILAEPPESLTDIPGDLGKKERDDILQRRKNLEFSSPEAPLRNTAGLALSGGGIRSATFCLGIVQTLAQKDLFHQFDYLSTVSGGGYLGSFLSSVLSGENELDKDRIPKQIIDDVLKTPPQRRESKAIRHLRNNSKYLGAGGIHWMAGLMIFGIFINLLLLLPAPLFLALGAYGLENVGFWGDPESASTTWLGLTTSFSSDCLLYSLEMLLVTALALPVIQSMAHRKNSKGWIKFREIWQTITLGLAITVLIFDALYLLPSLVQFLRNHNFTQSINNIQTLLITGILPFLLAHGSKFLDAWKRTQKFVLALFALSGLFFFLMIFLEALILLGFRQQITAISSLDLFIFTLLLFCWGWFFVNINTLSPHSYYRNRLCECYLLKRETKDIQEKIISRTNLPLAGLSEGDKTAPYHLINTTVNLTTSKNRELRGRNGDFFLISKHYCGSKVTGYYPTNEVVAKNPHIDLGSAMAISGAAASTGMGWQTMKNFRFLMGLMNIRLGYWLLNPKKADQCRLLQTPGLRYLFKEILGKMNEDDCYLNLSDGGHIENLAVYELLKRKCKFIVCVDGGQEGGMECADLIRLQRYAEIDLGIRMEYDISDLQLNDYRFTRAYAILVKVIYSEPNEDHQAEPGPELGWMLYLKLGMTGTEPAYVTDYRRINPSFPHQTTADQFFDEAQFEAYRMLGECAAASLFRDEIIGPSAPHTLQEWFQSVANNLLPDNDAAFL
jgi:hypothetical protein